MVRGPAGDDHDPAQVLDLELGEPDPLEHELAAARAVADRLAHRLRLLVDLLEHPRLVAALLGAFVVPVDRLDLLVIDLAVRSEEPSAVGCDRDDLAVVDQLDAARLAQERHRRRGEERLAVADADEQRAVMPRADEQPGVVAVDEVGHVFRQVAARLRDEVPEVAHQVEAHGIFGVDVWPPHGLAQPRVQVLSVVAELEAYRVRVDALYLEVLGEPVRHLAITSFDLAA